MTRLEFGDACFHGYGPNDDEYVIGVERKRIRDMLSSIRSKRLSGFQLPGMLEQYHRSFIIIEGIWRPNERGGIEIPSRDGWTTLYTGKACWLYKELDNFMTSLGECADVVVKRTGNPLETAVVLADLVGWWGKPWREHRSTGQSYIREASRGTARGSLVRDVPGIVWKMAAQLPSVDVKGKLVEKRFKSPLEMCQADVEDWLSIKGVGKKTAEMAVRLCQKGNGGRG